MLSASLTAMVKDEDPLAVGVPLMVPPVDSANPAGNAPDATLQV